MWIIQEPNKLELWNKLNFEQKKKESICHVENTEWPPKMYAHFDMKNITL